LLAELTRVHLLAEHVPGRYALRDLLRAYARELACAQDGESDRQAAVHRILDHYERAIELSRDVADRFNEADTISSLGDVHHSAGDVGAARRAWRAALRIFDEIEHPHRQKVQAKLRTPAPVAASAAR
jgi:hypothetical protein